MIGYNQPFLFLKARRYLIMELYTPFASFNPLHTEALPYAIKANSTFGFDLLCHMIWSPLRSSLVQNWM